MSSIPKVMLLVHMSRAPERAIVRGIARYSRLYGPWRFYREPIYYRWDSEKSDAISEIKRSHVDGLIVGPTEFDREMLELGIPVIMTAGVRNQPDHIPYIVGQDERIGHIAADHFLDRGFKNYAYCGFEGLSWSAKRQKSFTNRLKENGFTANIYEKPLEKRLTSREQEQKVLGEWIVSLPKPVGIFACNDDRAQQITETCQMESIRVPDDIAIIGVDNDDLVCEITNPPLSSIALNWEEAGYRAAEMMAGMLGDQQVEEKCITASVTHAVTRRSSDILAIKDEDVALALKYIREHAREPIQVRDVVEEVAVSRRCLYDKFRKILGRSIHQEIRKARTDQVARMLIETNLSISQIALELGYAGFDHIARHFRKEKGLTPLAYRKKFGNI